MIREDAFSKNFGPLAATTVERVVVETPPSPVGRLGMAATAATRRPLGWVAATCVPTAAGLLLVAIAYSAALLKSRGHAGSSGSA